MQFAHFGKSGRKGEVFALSASSSSQELKKKEKRKNEMYGGGKERKNACMEILSFGGSRIYERTSKTKEEFEEVHY